MPQSVHYTTGKIQLNQSIGTIFKSQSHNITNCIAKKQRSNLHKREKVENSTLKRTSLYIDVFLFLKCYKLNLFQSNECSNQQLYIH